MDEDLLLKQPSDRRLNVNTLPPGPPGAEFDTLEFGKYKTLLLKHFILLNDLHSH